jgi:hypothetical protein
MMADSDAATRAAAFDLIEKMVREEFVPPHSNNRRIETLSAELSRLTTLRPLSELTEADGMVLLWDEDDDGYWCSTGSLFAGRLLTDDQMVDAVAWTPLPKVRKPDGAR